MTGSMKPGEGRGPEFAKLPLDILRLPNQELSFGAKCLYARMLLYAGTDGICNPSDRTLGREVGATDRHVRNFRTELRECGLLSWKRTQKANSYRVHSPHSYRGPERNNSSHQSGTDVPVRPERLFLSERNDCSDKKMSFERGSSKEVLSPDPESDARAELSLCAC
jgi:hypothetical protein